MTTYYRVIDGELRELTAEQYAALAPNKREGLRKWVVDAQPTPAANQAVFDAGIVVGPVEAHQTWGLRAKTADELERDAIRGERGDIDAIISSIDTQRAVTREQWDGYTANQLRAEQWRDRQVLLRLAKLLARQIKREAV
jgi:hypothetical protein